MYIDKCSFRCLDKHENFNDIKRRLTCKKAYKFGNNDKCDKLRVKILGWTDINMIGK